MAAALDVNVAYFFDPKSSAAPRYTVHRIRKKVPIHEEGIVRTDGFGSRASAQEPWSRFCSCHRSVVTDIDRASGGFNGRSFRREMLFVVRGRARSSSMGRAQARKGDACISPERCRTSAQPGPAKGGSPRGYAAGRPSRLKTDRDTLPDPQHHLAPRPAGLEIGQRIGQLLKGEFRVDPADRAAFHQGGDVAAWSPLIR